MTEEFDALQGFDIFSTTTLVIGALVLGVVLEWGLRFAKRWTGSKGWSLTSVILQAFYWQPLFWCVLVAASAILASFSEFSATRQVGRGVIWALLLISITIVFVRIMTGWVKILVDRRSSVSASIVNYLINGVAVLIVLLVVLYILNVSVPLIVAALLGSMLGLSFALREPLSNLFAGLVLTASQRLAPGDFIRLPSGEKGQVKDIQWDVTLIHQIRGSQIIMPNSQMTQAEIINFDRPNTEFLLEVNVGVSYDSDLDRVEAVTIEVADDVLRRVHGGVLLAPSYTRYKTFGDSDIGFTVYLRCKDFVDRILVQHEFIKQLHKRYAQEGIEMPFPTLRLHSSNEEAFGNNKSTDNKLMAEEDIDI